ncbi:MAG: hypothetical protein WBD20_09235 [Pirellulaceae bacterium]
MFGFGPLELLVVATLAAGIPGVVWSWVDSAKDVYRPLARSLRISFIVSSLILLVAAALGGRLPMIGLSLFTLVTSAIVARVGYALGPARAMFRNRAATQLGRYTNAPVETGNPYQPPNDDPSADTLN